MVLDPDAREIPRGGGRRTDHRHGSLDRQRCSRKGQVSWRIAVSWRRLIARSCRRASASRIVKTGALAPSTWETAPTSPTVSDHKIRGRAVEIPSPAHGISPPRTTRRLGSAGPGRLPRCCRVSQADSIGVLIVNAHTVRGSGRMRCVRGERHASIDSAGVPAATRRRASIFGTAT